jgi:hypothetical protein
VARKEQQQIRNDPSSGDRDKNCTISWEKALKNLVNDVKKLNLKF